MRWRWWGSSFMSEDLRSCERDDGLSYWAWHEFAERMTAEGVLQDYCAVCRRWRFPSERCEEFERHPDSDVMRMEVVDVE